MFKDIKVPENNELKDVIQELLEYCDVKEEDGELGRTNFSEPVSEEEINNWEKENGTKIPESYKQWLRFTGDCEIDGTTASFLSPKNFRSEFVPDDLVVIGYQIGDGEMVCFSKESGEIVTYFEGNVRMKYGTFDKTINEILRMMGKPEEPEEELSDLEELKRERENIISYFKNKDEKELCAVFLARIEEEIKALEEEQ